MKNIASEYYDILFKDYSDVVTVKELSKMLSIGIKKAYALVNNGTILSIPCGKKIKVAKIFVIDYIINSSKSNNTHEETKRGESK